MSSRDADAGPPDGPTLEDVMDRPSGRKADQDIALAIREYREHMRYCCERYGIDLDEGEWWARETVDKALRSGI